MLKLYLLPCNDHLRNLVQILGATRGGTEETREVVWTEANRNSMLHLIDKTDRSEIEVGVANAEGGDKQTMSLVVEDSQPSNPQMAQFSQHLC